MGVDVGIRLFVVPNLVMFISFIQCATFVSFLNLWGNRHAGCLDLCKDFGPATAGSQRSLDSCRKCARAVLSYWPYLTYLETLIEAFRVCSVRCQHDIRQNIWRFWFFKFFCLRCKSPALFCLLPSIYLCYQKVKQSDLDARFRLFFAASFI